MPYIKKSSRKCLFISQYFFFKKLSWFQTYTKGTNVKSSRIKKMVDSYERHINTGIGIRCIEIFKCFIEKHFLLLTEIFTTSC